MTEQLFFLNRKPDISLQTQIQEMLVSLILDEHLKPGLALPSCRKLAQTLEVSRNTVVLVYERLLDEGYLISKERQGHFVNPELPSVLLRTELSDKARISQAENWQNRFKKSPSQLHFLKKPATWRECDYPFIYGQIDPKLFPAAEWRECSRMATSSLVSREWAIDSFDADDPLLLEQLRNRVLPRRGVRCNADEILVTLGTQHSLYLLANLLTGPGTTVGVESPGYIDAHNIFTLAGSTIKALPIDDNGLQISNDLNNCQYLFVTASHQFPTTVTMPLDRRKSLLAKAAEHNQIIIEDDYECEVNFIAQPTPALQSLDQDGRVIYVGSLSKTLAPGLRMGYLVGPAPLIKEARALRRLMLRHPPSNNQRTLALFLSGGYHDSLIRKLTSVYRERREILINAINKYLPQIELTPSNGGSSLWCKGPENFDSTKLQQRAFKQGLFIEAMEPCFFEENPPKNCFRLGYSAIETDRIEPGIKLLAQLINSQ